MSDKWTELEKLAKAANLLQSTRQTTCPECGFAWYGYRHRYGCNISAANRDYRIKLAESPQIILNLIALARSEAVLREALQIAGEGLRWGHRLAHFDAESLQVKAIRTVSKALAESDKLRSGK